MIGVYLGFKAEAAKDVLKIFNWTAYFPQTNLAFNYSWNWGEMFEPLFDLTATYYFIYNFPIVGSNEKLYLLL